MGDYSLEALNLFLEGNVYLESWGSEENPQLPFKITSKEFLEYAKKDLSSEKDHYLVNALSNIKRSLDCQIDSLLYYFGLLNKSRKEKWGLPHKTSTLEKIGVVSPRFLNKINSKRNLLEHYYELPSKEEIEDALDIAILFIEYTSGFIKGFLGEFSIHNDTLGKSVQMEIIPSASKIIFTEPVLNGSEGYETITKKEISAESSEYIAYLQIYVKFFNLKR